MSIHSCPDSTYPSGIGSPEIQATLSQLDSELGQVAGIVEKHDVLLGIKNAELLTSEQVFSPCTVIGDLRARLESGSRINAMLTGIESLSVAGIMPNSPAARYVVKAESAKPLYGGEGQQFSIMTGKIVSGLGLHPDNITGLFAQAESPYRQWKDGFIALADSFNNEPIISEGAKKGLYDTLHAIKASIVHAEENPDVVTSLDQVNITEAKQQLLLMEIVPDDEAFEEICALYATAALLDTYRALRTAPFSFLKPEVEASLREKGVTDEEITLLNASRFLDLAAQYATDGSLRESVSVFIYALFKKELDERNLEDNEKVGRALSIIIRTVDTVMLLHNGMNAYEIMREAYAGAVRVESIISAARTKLGEVVTTANNNFYQRAGALAISSKGPDTALEILAAEDYKAGRLESVVYILDSAGSLSNHRRAALLELARDRRIVRYLDGLLHEQQKASSQETAAEIRQEIQRLEEPYTYRSKRIRQFIDGVSLTREIERELGKPDFKIDDVLAKALAMIIAMSEASDNRVDFFEELDRTRTVIDEWIETLRTTGDVPSHTSPLAEVLHWIDEMIDSGKYEKIKNVKIQTFIDHYSMPLQDEPLALKQSSPADKDSRDSNKSAEDTQEVELTDAQRAAIQEYTSLLDIILDGVKLSYSHVRVFPPGKSISSAESRVEGRISRRRTGIDIDIDRVEKLVELAQTLERQGKFVQLYKTDQTSWSILPPFALFVRSNPEAEKGICLIESPVNKHATYIVPVDGENIASWEDAARLSRKEARSRGADALTHPPKGSPNFGDHYSLRLMSEILTGLRILAN